MLSVALEYFHGVKISKKKCSEGILKVYILLLNNLALVYSNYNMSYNT